METYRCYGFVSTVECEADPKKVIMTDIEFEGSWAPRSNKLDPVVGSLVYSSERVSQVSRILCK